MLTRKSFARLTLALDIIKKLESGFHELSVLKHQIDLADLISIEEAKQTEIFCDHPDVPLDQANFCWQAVDLVKREFKIDKHVQIHIEKKIPVQGGLAGGSSNVATVLILLNELWGLKLSVSKLQNMAEKISKDAPYFFQGGTVFDKETNGERRKIESALSFVFVVVLPKVGVSTKQAYSNLDYSLLASQAQRTSKMEKAFLENKPQVVIKNVHNDFELSVFKSYPKLESIKNNLLKLGCLAAGMSGSGSVIYGITTDLAKAKEIKWQLKEEAILVLSKY